MDRKFWDDIIKAGLVILLTAMLCLVVYGITKAQVVEYKFTHPGMGGMVSNYDVGTLDATQAFYMLNGYVTETPGRIERRVAIADYDTAGTILYGAFGYYNLLTGHKLVIGVTDHDTNSFGKFIVSDTFDAFVDTTTLDGTIFPWADCYHDWTPFEDGLVHADGKSIPCVFTTSQGFMYKNNSNDTNGFDAHLISMGLEAPGQLRLGLIDSTTTFRGDYEYACVYWDDSAIGIVSRIVRPVNEAVYITNFPMDTGIYLLRRVAGESHDWYRIDSFSVTTSGYYYIDTGGANSTIEVIGYWDNGSEDTLWDTFPSPYVGYYYSPYSADIYQCCNKPVYLVDSVGYKVQLFKWADTFYCNEKNPPHNLYCGSMDFDSVKQQVDSFYLDTIQVGASIFHPAINTYWRNDSSFTYDPSLPAYDSIHYVGHKPGQFVFVDTALVIDTTGGDSTDLYIPPDSLYYIAYSYYDPITGMESPVGPLLTCSLTYQDTDTIFSTQFRFDEFDTILNPKWIRVYQTLTKTTLAGASDTMVLRGILQVRAFDGSVVLGNWNDDSVYVGLDTSYIEVKQYYGYQMYYGVLPPYNYTCQIPFSDIEYIGGYLFGIGDPDEPNRIYRSSSYNIFSWHPLDFTQINEIGNDELIAIERAEGFGDDALYVIAHNSSWIMDKEGYNYQQITTNTGETNGAASRESVIKHGGMVYFVSPDLKIYALSGTQLAEISIPVENYVESVFVDYNIYGFQGYHAWGQNWGDYVRWFNDSTGLGISFNTKSGAWSLERYGSALDTVKQYVPRGSFFYDTLHSTGARIAPTSDVELLYTDSAVSLRKADPSGYYDVAGSGYSKFEERAIRFTYWTPRMGDGVHYQTVNEFDLTIKAKTGGGAFHYTIYNGNGDSLCHDSIAFLVADTVLTYRIQPAYNLCMWPSIKIYSNHTDSMTIGETWGQYYHSFDLIDLNVKVRNMGVGLAQ